MYICRECKTKYKEKVAYCDCGNNTFDFVEDKQLTISPKQPLTLEQKSEIVSWSFLGICLLLSLIVWLIPIGNTKDNVEQPKQQKAAKPQTRQAIPDIEKIWDDTPLYAPKTQQPQAEKSQLDILREEISNTTPYSGSQKKNQLIDINTNNFAPVSPKKIETNRPYTPKTQSSQKPSAQPKQQISKPAKTGVSSSPKKLDEKPIYNTPSYNPNSPEMQRYKNNLRAALFSKLAVGSISGAGECTVQFSVNQDGKLINRKFAKESSNKALNDAVYYMLMSVPKFQTPPEEYNGQTIQMNIKIDYGNYEISIH